MMTQLTKEKFGHLAKKEDYCPGYVDAYGQWNNGFRCPLSLQHREQVCCGTSENRFCCEPIINDVTRLQPISTHAPGTKLGTPETVAVIFGMCVGSLVLLFVAFVAMYYLVRRCHRNKNAKNKQRGFPVCSKGDQCVLFTRPVHCICRQAHFYQNADSKKPYSDYFLEEPPSYEDVVDSHFQLTNADRSAEKDSLVEENENCACAEEARDSRNGGIPRSTGGQPCCDVTAISGQPSSHAFWI